jgi:lipopolysaccharide/colanic/teichoic acid biosynthesis glycosyltransferase
VDQFDAAPPTMPVDFLAHPVDLTLRRQSTARVNEASGLPVVGVDCEEVSSYQSIYFSTWHKSAKRALDIAVSALALVALAPLLLIVSVLIKISSPGPVLFYQDREGLDGCMFSLAKFRSMRADVCDASGTRQTCSDDPRVTRIGKFIRKTSIDELPQLFNVLRGDMSIVGPRPHVPGMFAGGRPYRELVEYYDARLRARPGLTGWAQANGFRGATNNAEKAVARIDHDIAYIQNFSIWLDLRIIWLTARKEFFSGTGY